MIDQLNMKIEEIIANSKASIEKEDLRVLLPVIAGIKPKNILEIGTWRGYSMEVWYQAFHPKNLITIENDFATQEIISERMLNGEFAYMNPSPTGIYMDSHDEKSVLFVKNVIKDELLDFLFIDGDHSYDGVRKDFEMYSPLVRSGGIIAFHDALYHAEKTEEVDLYWDYRMRKKYPYLEIKAGKNSTGIGVIWV